MRIEMHRKISRLVFLPCWFGLLAPYCAHSQVYSGISAEGTLVLSNFSSPESRELLIAPSNPAGAESARARSMLARSATVPAAFKDMVEDAALEYGLDPRLLHAMIKVESSYDPRALSAKGARGLMQLMPDTARRFRVADAFDPRENIRGGAEYIHWLLKLFRGDLQLALAGYNAGEQAVIRAGYRIPAYAETRDYVSKVLAHYR